MEKKIAIQRTFKIVGFLSALAALLIGLYFAFVPLKGGKYTATRTYSLNRIFNERQNSLDVIVLGHSGVYAGVSPMEMYARYGFTSYDCAQALQMPWETYECLYDVLAVQSPRVVVLEVDHLFYDSKPLLKANRTKRLGRRIFPFYEMHIAWKDAFHAEARNALKGYIYTDIVRPYKGKGNDTKPTDEKRPLGAKHAEYLQKIYELCKERGIALCLVELPSLKFWDEARHNTVQEYADAHGLRFLDMNRSEEVGIDWQTDTRDGGDHLNYAGAVKASAYLGAYLSEQYALVSRKDDPAYADWKEDYARYEEAVR